MKKKPLMGMGVAIALAATCLHAQAGPLDLTGPTSSGTINDATYSRNTSQPGGSGVIDSFVRIRSNRGIEQAYNTTVDPVYDNTNDDTFNHQITVGQAGFIDLNGATPGGEVMRFLLDINQAANENDRLLNLDEVQIYLSRIPNQSLQPALMQGGTISFADSTLVYQMDANGADNWVILNAALNSGSGSGDMFLDIPIAAFNTAFSLGNYTTVSQRNAAYIYLYSRFGSSPNENTSGFEEWATIQGNPIPDDCPAGRTCGEQQVPEPGSLALLGIGLAGAGILSRRRRNA